MKYYALTVSIFNLKSLFVFKKIESNYSFYTIINEILFVFGLFMFSHYRVLLFISILKNRNLFILSYLEKILFFFLNKCRFFSFIGKYFSEML